MAKQKNAITKVYTRQVKKLTRHLKIAKTVGYDPLRYTV